MKPNHGMKKAIVAAYQAATGRYISAGITTLTNWKAITGLLTSLMLVFCVLCSLLTCIPGISMQSDMPTNQSWMQNLSNFAYTQIQKTSSSIASTIFAVFQALQKEADESDEEGVIATISGDINEYEVLILYCVLYGEYLDEKELDQDKVREITREYMARHGFSITMRTFDEVVERMDLTEEQRVIAYTMYDQYMYDQYYVGTGESEGYRRDYADIGELEFVAGAVDVVYFNQTDPRWKHLKYGDGTIGGAGCGPTSLAMAISTLTDKTVDPVQMCDWAYENGYKAKGGGSYWSLIPDAAAAFGLKVEGNVKSKQKLLDALGEGKLVIAIMGASSPFTNGGHFIVLRGVTDSGRILVADSNSRKRTFEQDFSLHTVWTTAKQNNASGGPFWIVSAK